MSRSVLVAFLLTVVSLAVQAMPSAAFNPPKVEINGGLVTVTPASVIDVVGAPITVPVNVSDTTGLGIISFQFTLLYNPAVLSADTPVVSQTGTISSGMTPTINEVMPGQINVVLFTTTDRAGAGVLFNLKFTAIGMAGQSSAITLQNFMFNEGNPADLTTPGNVFLLPPTSAPASVGGRVTTSDGRGLTNAVVSMTDAQGITRNARTSAFGYYRFEDVQTGATYVMNVQSKRYQFQPRSVTVNEEIGNVDFVAQPQN